MQYQVLARKWRPQTFAEIVGQEHVSRTLLNALESGRVAHAFLFSGPRGSGKTTTARILAKALNCHKGNTGEPCGTCVACTEIAAGNCIDVLEMDAASNRGIDEIRQLREQVQYKPARDARKIFIIDEAHMLTEPAFNALLKTLEEPPPYVAFILATTEYHKIPITILSRCQQYSFKLIAFPKILERVRHIAREEKIGISENALEQIVFSSGGSMRDAMSALDQVIAFSGETVRDEDVTMLLGLVAPAVLSEVTHALAKSDPDRLLKVVADLVEAGQDLQNFCRRLVAHIRNLVVLGAGTSDPALLGIPESRIPDLKEQAKLFSHEDLLRLFDGALKLDGELRYATQIRFQLEMGLIELAQLPRMRRLEELIADFQRLVGGDVPPGSTAPPTPSQAPGGGKAPGFPRNPPASPARGRPRSTGAGAGAAMRAAEPEPEEAESPESRIRPVPSPSPDARQLLEKIARGVRKESLESILLSLDGALLEGNQVTLDPGDASEFYRKQIEANLPLVAQAASTAAGRSVTVRVASARAAEPKAAPAMGGGSGDDVLERASREPVVRSFLDIFPGPVKAEKIEP